MTWTPDRIATLRKLAAERLTTSQIAAALRVTRNAVCGKLFRLGLSADSPSHRNTSIRARMRSGKRPAKKRAPKAWHLPEPLNVPEAKKLSLDVLTQRTCRWPIGDPREADFHFCGHDCLAGQPYCSAHMRTAYREGTSTPLERRVRERLEAA